MVCFLARDSNLCILGKIAYSALWDVVTVNNYRTFLSVNGNGNLSHLVVGLECTFAVCVVFYFQCAAHINGIEVPVTALVVA